jgi:SAM-dependent methyltransferase
MLINQLTGWDEDETIQYYITNRKKYDDLYKSEKYFLTKSFISGIEDILDVGCSVGGIYTILQELNKDIKYTGLDVSLNAILHAKQLHRSEFTSFYHYDGNAPFPLNKQTYNLVFCSGVMHLIDNYKSVFQQMVESSNKYLLIDFRLTNQATYRGKFYFTFSDKIEASNFTNYHVVNFKELMTFFSQFKQISHIYIYGYKGHASAMSEGIDEVYMVFFKIKLATITNDTLEVIFEDTSLKDVLVN